MIITICVIVLNNFTKNYIKNRNFKVHSICKFICTSSTSHLDGSDRPVYQLFWQGRPPISSRSGGRVPKILGPCIFQWPRRRSAASTRGTVVQHSSSLAVCFFLLSFLRSTDTYRCTMKRSGFSTRNDRLAKMRQALYVTLTLPPLYRPRRRRRRGSNLKQDILRQLESVRSL